MPFALKENNLEGYIVTNNKQTPRQTSSQHAYWQLKQIFIFKHDHRTIKNGTRTSENTKPKPENKHYTSRASTWIHRKKKYQFIEESIERWKIHPVAAALGQLAGQSFRNRHFDNSKIDKKTKQAGSISWRQTLKKLSDGSPFSRPKAF